MVKFYKIFVLLYTISTDKFMWLRVTWKNSINKNSATFFLKSTKYYSYVLNVKFTGFELTFQ